ncbi:MAG TPA: hypothetical protein VNA86_14695 [bacterium]|nr:hypothetical protein [bacterium]
MRRERYHAAFDTSQDGFRVSRAGGHGTLLATRATVRSCGQYVEPGRATGNPTAKLLKVVEDSTPYR